MAIRLVYVDDETDLLELFADMFSSPEVRIETYSDPVRAIEAIRANPPDLLFLDHRLPRTTGDQIARQLDPEIPKALVTGDVTVLLESRFEAVFEKPFPIAKVREFIQSYVDRAR
jgi:DNA-binding response OmpR family regulator